MAKPEKRMYPDLGAFEDALSAEEYAEQKGMVQRLKIAEKEFNRAVQALVQKNYKVDVDILDLETFYGEEPCIQVSIYKLVI